MFEDDQGRERFAEAMRAIALEVSRSIERVADVDLQEIAEAVGVDLGRARELAEDAVGWLRAQAEDLGGGIVRDGAPRAPSVDEDLRAGGGPHPLDLPTDAQGGALAAVDSGRFVVEPGSGTLAAEDGLSGLAGAPGIVDELRARDWISAEGEITQVGRHALGRWLETAGQH